jgi:hypothetical protein
VLIREKEEREREWMRIGMVLPVRGGKETAGRG